MNIARIARDTGIVVNIEVADQAWIDAHVDDPDFIFVPYTAGTPAVVGLGWDPVTGFEQPPPVVEP